MAPPPSTPRDVEEFRASLAEAVSRAASIGEIEAWLRGQPSVSLARTEDYLLKSYPPQRRFIVELELADGPPVATAIDVYTFDDKRFLLRDIHDA